MTDLVKRSRDLFKGQWLDEYGTLECQLLVPGRIFIFCPTGTDDKWNEQMLTMIGIDGGNTSRAGCGIHLIQTIEQREDVFVAHPLGTQFL